jgi:hypothetical protein
MYPTMMAFRLRRRMARAVAGVRAHATAKRPSLARGVCMAIAVAALAIPPPAQAHASRGDPADATDAEIASMAISNQAMVCSTMNELFVGDPIHDSVVVMKITDLVRVWAFGEITNHDVAGIVLYSAQHYCPRNLPNLLAAKKIS